MCRACCISERGQLSRLERLWRPRGLDLAPLKDSVPTSPGGQLSTPNPCEEAWALTYSTSDSVAASLALAGGGGAIPSSSSSTVMAEAGERTSSPPAPPFDGSAPSSVAGGGRCSSLFSGPVLKSVAFIALLILIAALSATVLQEPIADSAEWLRRAGIGGYFLLAAVGYVFLVCGGSSTLFDIICGFVYGARDGLIVSWVVKMLSACTCFFVAKYLFHDYLRRHLFRKYVYLEALEVMVRERPWQTVSILRLSVLPAAIKSYGMGALGAPFLPFVVTAVVTFAVLSWVLADMGSRISKPSELFHAKSKSSVILEGVGVACALLMVGFGAYYGRKYSQEILAARSREGGGEGSSRGRGGGKIAVAADCGDEGKWQQQQQQHVVEIVGPANPKGAC